MTDFQLALGFSLSEFIQAYGTEERVSATTQNQALAALLFLYRTVLGGDVVRAN